MNQRRPQDDRGEERGEIVMGQREVERRCRCGNGPQLSLTCLRRRRRFTKNCTLV